MKKQCCRPCWVLWDRMLVSNRLVSTDYDVASGTWSYDSAYPYYLQVAGVGSVMLKKKASAVPYHIGVCFQLNGGPYSPAGTVRLIFDCSDDGTTYKYLENVIGTSVWNVKDQSGTVIATHNGGTSGGYPGTLFLSVEVYSNYILVYWYNWCPTVNNWTFNGIGSTFTLRLPTLNGNKRCGFGMTAATGTTKFSAIYYGIASTKCGKFNYPCADTTTHYSPAMMIYPSGFTDNCVSMNNLAVKIGNGVNYVSYHNPTSCDYLYPYGACNYCTDVYGSGFVNGYAWGVALMSPTYTGTSYWWVQMVLCGYSMYEGSCMIYQKSYTTCPDMMNYDDTLPYSGRACDYERNCSTFAGTSMHVVSSN